MNLALARIPPPHPGLTEGLVYLHCNATTPVDPRVVAAMWPHVSDFFGNPSTGYWYAEHARSVLAQARSSVASLIGATPGEMVFTSSGSEADLLAIRGAVLASGHPHPHVITQATEHPAMLGSCRAGRYRRCRDHTDGGAGVPS